MKTHHDLIIIGAGPAGLAAAVTARTFGLSVLVLDEQHHPGGQIYKALENARLENSEALGKDYFSGQELLRSFRQSGVDYLAGTTVWHLGEDRSVGYLVNGQARLVTGSHILIAAGAMERPVPIPGWTLPGVMGAAAADILFKACDMVPEGPVVLAGSGPLLLLVACRLIDNGVQIAGMVETTGTGDVIRALPHLPQALHAYPYLLKGMGMQLKIFKARVPRFKGATKLSITGEERAMELSFTSGGKQQTLVAKTFVLHEGVVPNVQMTRLLGCTHVWYERQRYWKPVLDAAGNTSLSGVSVAGDAGGIFGAKSAEAAGHLAAIDIAHRLQVVTSQEKSWASTPFLKVLACEKTIRPFLDAAFPPSREALVPPSDQALVCRCEELTAGQIREAVAEGAISPGQVKAVTRCGMGPCQGRMCGLTMAEIIADARRIPVSEVGQLKVRPPLKPITIGQLADLEIGT